MSKESAETKIHEAVEEAIENNLSVKDFIKLVSISWQEFLAEKERYAEANFNKLLKVEGVY